MNRCKLTLSYPRHGLTIHQKLLYPKFFTQKMEIRLCKAVIIGALQRRIYTQKYSETQMIFVLAIIFLSLQVFGTSF